MIEQIKKRDYQQWLDFCTQVQNSTSVKLNESKQDQKARIKACLKDYNLFFKTYLSIYADHDCAPFHIKLAKAVLKDPNFFGVAEWPREHAKSVHMNIGIPMFLIAHGELTGMILMGKNNDDASNLLADVQAQLMSNDLFANDFGKQYSFGSWEEGDFTTKQGIRFLAVGRNQSPRGARKNEKRPNYASIDDIDDDELVENPKRVKKVVKNILGALYFALSIKGARVVMGGNRIHNNSVLANIVGDTKPGKKKRKGLWHDKRVALTDIKYNAEGEMISGKPVWNRYTFEELKRKIIKAGHVHSQREFFHKTEIEGSIFKNRYFRFAKIPNLRLMQVIIGYFDPSFENNPTSDFKSAPVWALRGQKRYCLARFCRRCEIEDAFEWMVHFEKKLPLGVGMIWYVEKQFYNRPIINAKARVERKTKHRLNVITDERIKPGKYTRIVRMEPEYSSGNVIYNLDEIEDTDMIEGNNQVKGIEPGYNSPDDAPDSDEGAWYYLDQHITEDNPPPAAGKREIDETRRY
jgi:hypothetical protein